MQPKTKFQKKAVEASKKLSPLTDAQLRWAYTKVIESVGQRTKKGIVTCLNCGEVFHNATTQKHCACPACRTKLRIEDTRKQKFQQREYATYITACDGLQVIRVFMVNYYAKVGRPLNRFCHEVMQRWIAPDGKYCTFARSRMWCSMYYDQWIYSSKLELHGESWVYDRIYTDDIYSRMKLIPELKRTGYKGGLYGQNPTDLFRILLTDNRAESLLKIGQESLFRLYLDDKSRRYDDYWPSIRIAVRNGYKVEDAMTWCDYIDALRTLDKDIRNPKYVCPADLSREHDRCIAKLARLEADRNLMSHLKNECAYYKAKARFFGLAFSDGRIAVRVLESVKEIIMEGKVMHHCVATNKYYQKADSLILSATINGKRLETVEVSLSKLQVIQSRGVCNHNTEYHDRIVELVNSNMRLIEKRIAA